MALASSVTVSPAASSASRRRPMRNIWGVCASHLSARSMVATALPSRACLSVSGKRWASRPPTASPAQACTRRSICAGVTRQRAASCTSTQSCGRAPCCSSHSNALNTVIALVAPAHSAMLKVAFSGGKACVARWTPAASSGATATTTALNWGTLAKAASVCASTD